MLPHHLSRVVLRLGLAELIVVVRQVHLSTHLLVLLLVLMHWGLHWASLLSLVIINVRIGGHDLLISAHSVLLHERVVLVNNWLRILMLHRLRLLLGICLNILGLRNARRDFLSMSVR